MNLAYAFFANSAEFSDNGLFVLGGDFDTIRSASFPTVPIPISVVVKICFSPSECDRQYRFRIDLRGSLGQGTEESFLIEPQTNDEYPERDTGVGIVINLAGLSFGSPGDYALRIFVEDTELKTLILHLEREEPTVTQTVSVTPSFAEKGSVP
jgi:hypothetical protein